MKTRPQSHDAAPGSWLHHISSLLELLHLDIKMTALICNVHHDIDLDNALDDIDDIDLEARGQGLLQLFSLLLVCDLQCVEES